MNQVNQPTHVNMSVDFIKFNNITFVLNYFFTVWGKSHIQSDKKEIQLIKPVNNGNLSYSSKPLAKLTL